MYNINLSNSVLLTFVSIAILMTFYVGYLVFKKSGTNYIVPLSVSIWLGSFFYIAFMVSFDSDLSELKLEKLSKGSVFVPMNQLNDQLGFEKIINSNNCSIASWGSDIYFWEEAESASCSFKISTHGKNDSLSVFCHPNGGVLKIYFDGKEHVIDTKDNVKHHVKIPLQSFKPISVYSYVFFLVCILLLFNLTFIIICFFNVKTNDIVLLMTSVIVCFCLLNFNNNFLLRANLSSTFETIKVLFAAFLVASGVIYLVIKYVFKIRDLWFESRWIFIPFIAFLTWYLFWAIVVYPSGMYMSDTYAVNAYVTNLNFSHFFGKFYELFVLSQCVILPYGFTQVLFEIVMVSLVFTRCIFIFHSLGLNWIFLIVLTISIFFSIPIICNSVFLTRDTWFSMLLVMVTVELFNFLITKSRKINYILYIINLLILTSVFRSESVVYLFLTTVLIVIFLIFKPIYLKNFISPLLVLIFIYWVIPMLISFKSSDKYMLTSYLNPLSILIKNDNYFTLTPDRDSEIINNMLQVDSVKKYATPYELPNFWLGHYKESATEKEFDDLEKTAYKLFLNNSDVFFESRIYNFINTTGLSNHNTLEIGETYNNGNSNLLFKKNPKSPFPSIQKYLVDFIYKSTQFSGYHVFFSRFYIWSFIPALVLVFFVLFLYKFTPISSICVLFISLRIPLVFLFSPASQFKYYYSLYLIGFMILPFLIIEARKNNLIQWAYNKLSVLKMHLKNIKLE